MAKDKDKEADQAKATNPEHPSPRAVEAAAGGATIAAPKRPAAAEAMGDPVGGESAPPTREARYEIRRNGKTVNWTDSVHVAYAEDGKKGVVVFDHKAGKPFAAAQKEHREKKEAERIAARRKRPLVRRPV